MHTETTPDPLLTSRQFFESGMTRPYTWRREQLQRLYNLIAANETAIQQALYADLRKSAEEAYATETGLVLAEIRHTLKHLRRWMRPSQEVTMTHIRCTSPRRSSPTWRTTPRSCATRSSVPCCRYLPFGRRRKPWILSGVIPTRWPSIFSPAARSGYNNGSGK